MRVPHRLSHPFRLSRLLLCLSIGLANAAWAHPEYRVTVVGPANSSANDINKDGVVVGSVRISDTVTHAFLNRGNGVVYTGPLGAASSDAVAINNKGKVLGNWTNPLGEERGYTYRAGVRHDIGVIPGRVTTYTDINNHGFITAYGAMINGDLRAFLRAPDGTFTDLGSLPVADPLTYAYALNNHNQVTGASGPLTFPEQPYRAFLWAKGVLQDLGDFGSAPNYGRAINSHGQITGSMSVMGIFHNRIAYLYSNGRLIDIDGRPASANRSSEGAGINNLGHIVGVSNHLSGFVYRGHQMQSLNALINPKPKWDISYPRAINDAGQIAATARRNGVQYAVRLDLIRPMMEQAPEMEADDAAEPTAAEQADAKADAEAQAREVVLPVQQ